MTDIQAAIAKLREAKSNDWAGCEVVAITSDCFNAMLDVIERTQNFVNGGQPNEPLSVAESRMIDALESLAASVGGKE